MKHLTITLLTSLILSLLLLFATNAWAESSKSIPDCDNLCLEVATIELHLEAEHDTARTSKTSYRHKDERLGESELQNRVILGGGHIKMAIASFDESGLPQVNITLDDQGGALLHRATRSNIGKRLGVLLIVSKFEAEEVVCDILCRSGIGTGSFKLKEDTEVIHVKKELTSLATIRGALGTQFRITGLDSPEEASELALLLRRGSQYYTN